MREKERERRILSYALILLVEISTTFKFAGKDLRIFAACFLFLTTKVYIWVAKRNLNLVAAEAFLILTPSRRRQSFGDIVVDVWM